VRGRSKKHRQILRSTGNLPGELPEAVADWSLTSLQLKLVKIGARVLHHARAITFQLAEAVVTGPMVRAILATIQRLRAPPSCARPRSKPQLNKSGRTRLPDALKKSPPGCNAGGLRADPPNCGRLRDHRRRSGRETRDQLTHSGDLYVRQPSTLGSRLKNQCSPQKEHNSSTTHYAENRQKPHCSLPLI
jgi:hypothetical protein